MKLKMLNQLSNGSHAFKLANNDNLKNKALAIMKANDNKQYLERASKRANIDHSNGAEAEQSSLKFILKDEKAPSALRRAAHFLMFHSKNKTSPGTDSVSSSSKFSFDKET